MMRWTLLFAVTLVAGSLLIPGSVVAAGPGDAPSDDAGPPGFVGDLVPEFLGDLFDALPVPDFLKSVFGMVTSPLAPLHLA